MENPFEIILERLDRIEHLIQQRANEVPSADKETEDQLMNVTALAEYLSLSRTTIYSMTHRREIPFYKKGKRLYFRQSDIDTWINEGRSKTHDEIEREALNYILKNPIRRR
jgi:excisionase family DNA binding protein